MATYTATAAAVSGSSFQRGAAGEAITAGDVLYRSTTTGTWFKATAATLAGSYAAAIALSSAQAAGQVIDLHLSGRITLYAASVLPKIGGVLALSSTAGRAMDVADLVDGQYSTILGYALDDTDVFFSPLASGLAIANAP